MSLLIVLSVTAVILITAFLLHSYVFSIYETVFDPIGKEFKSGDTITITTRPINGFGFKAPLRTSPFKYEIKEGPELFIVVKDESPSGNLVLKFTDTGDVKILVSPEHALKPTLFEFRVHPSNLRESASPKN